jgi:hypothetical protein
MNMMNKVDKMMVGGGIAYTFLKVSSHGTASPPCCAPHILGMRLSGLSEDLRAPILNIVL